MNMSSVSSTSTDFSFNDQLSNDTFDITRRGRQDVLLESRLVSTRLASPFGGPSEMMFPMAPAAPAPASPVVPTSIPSSNGKRRVNFAGSVVINEGLEESISEEEVTQRWWTQNDLDEIKRRAKEMSIRLRRQAKEKGCSIATAHKKTSLMLTNDFKELVKLSASSPDQDLRHWCARSDGRRGLERFASREYGIMRKDDVTNARDAVFQEQERQRQKNLYLPEAISKVSKAKSRRSRTFSLFMGEADAQASARGVSRQGSAKRSKVVHTASKTVPPQNQHRMAEVRGFSLDGHFLASSQ